MRFRRAIRLAACMAVLALAALGSAPAGAEPVLELGHGRQSSAVTDAAGTLHAVWRDPTSTPVSQPMFYCRVAAGGNACAPVQLTTDVRGAPRLFVRPQDGVLIIVFPGVDGTLGATTRMMASGDGGTTWTTPANIGVGLADIDDAALSPDGGFVDTVTSLVTGEVLFQRVSLAGGVEQRVVSLGVKKDLRPPRVAHLPDGRPVVIAHYATDRIGARVAATGADPDVQASWGLAQAWRSLAHVDASDADVGPTGTWLLATVSRSAIDGSFPVRTWRWGPRGFEHPRTVGALARRSGGSVGQAQPTPLVALDVDLAGRLHAAWPLTQPACGGRLCIVYRRTDRNGFGPPIVYPVGQAVGDTVERFAVAANSGGSGWLVWDDLSDRVRAVPLVTPPRGSRVGSRRIGRRRVTIPDFYGCVPSGGVFVHRLRIDGRRGARIVSVRFFFDAGQPARTDHRAPFRIEFRLAFGAGSRHVAGAIVRYRLPGERRVRSVRLGRTFVMC
jgi:hypothetical protein